MENDIFFLGRMLHKTVLKDSCLPNTHTHTLPETRGERRDWLPLWRGYQARKCLSAAGKHGISSSSQNIPGMMCSQQRLAVPGNKNTHLKHSSSRQLHQCEAKQRAKKSQVEQSSKQCRNSAETSTVHAGCTCARKREVNSKLFSPDQHIFEKNFKQSQLMLTWC